MAKTANEIAELKRGWSADPCWDIEDTEGFEAHRDELKTFRLETENAQYAVRMARLNHLRNELNAFLEGEM